MIYAFSFFLSADLIAGNAYSLLLLYLPTKALIGLLSFVSKKIGDRKERRFADWSSFSTDNV